MLEAFRLRFRRRGALQLAVGRALRDAERSLLAPWVAHQHVAQKRGVTDLATMVELFLPRAGDLVREHHVAAASVPDAMLLGVVLNVVKDSRTHSCDEVDQAGRALAAKLASRGGERAGAPHAASTS